MSCLQVRSLVDVPGEKLPSAATGELAAYLRTTVAPQVQPPSQNPKPSCNPDPLMHLAALPRHYLHAVRALMGSLGDGLAALCPGGKHGSSRGRECLTKCRVDSWNVAWVEAGGTEGACAVQASST